MNRLITQLGFWGFVDEILQWIGSAATWHLKRRHSTEEERTADAATGGALVWLVLGAAVGFAFSHSARNINVIVGTILGALLGACSGVMFGATVEAVDSTIKDLLRSLNSK